MDSCTPTPFTEEELADIDSVIRAYIKDVDQTLLIHNPRLSVEQRLVNGEAYPRDAAAMQRSAVASVDK